MNIPKIKALYRLSLATYMSISIAACVNMTGDENHHPGEKPAASIQELKPLAEAGNPDAQFRLGTMYLTGHGVRKSEAEALTWYRKAADQENADAQIALSNMYKEGIGTEKDSVMSAYWKWKADEVFEHDAKQLLLTEVTSAKYDDVPIEISPNNCAIDDKSILPANRGTTEAIILIGATGKVEDVIITKSSGSKIYDNAVKSALISCAFMPGKKNGKPVPAFWVMEYVSFRDLHVTFPH